MKTFRAKPEDILHKWYLIDLKEKVLGRVAVDIARFLMGKNEVSYSRDVDNGNFVIVLNCDKIVLTGKKAETKVYHRHSGYPGGLKTETFEEKLKKDPGHIIKEAVKGMLPKNKAGRGMLDRLKIYANGEHPHSAQKPELIEL